MSAAGELRLVIFDFDGTLVDSAQCIATSLERALRQHGQPCDVTDVRRHIGRTLVDAILEVSPDIPPSAIRGVIEAYRRHHAELELELVPLFDGVYETLAALRELGIRLAIATNKSTGAALPSLERFGIRAWFDVVVGADQVDDPKPHPAIARHILAATGVPAAASLVVGDTVVDLEMAARAGIRACAVTYGNHNADQLATAAPAFTIDHISELISVVTRLSQPQ